MTARRCLGALRDRSRQCCRGPPPRAGASDRLGKAAGPARATPPATCVPALRRNFSDTSSLICPSWPIVRSFSSTLPGDFTSRFACFFRLRLLLRGTSLAASRNWADALEARDIADATVDARRSPRRSCRRPRRARDVAANGARPAVTGRPRRSCVVRCGLHPARDEPAGHERLEISLGIGCCGWGRRRHPVEDERESVRGIRANPGGTRRRAAAPRRRSPPSRESVSLQKAHSVRLSTRSTIGPARTSGFAGARDEMSVPVGAHLRRRLRSWASGCSMRSFQTSSPRVLPRSVLNCLEAALRVRAAQLPSTSRTVAVSLASIATSSRRSSAAHCSRSRARLISAKRSGLLGSARKDEPPDKNSTGSQRGCRGASPSPHGGYRLRRRARSSTMLRILTLAAGLSLRPPPLPTGPRLPAIGPRRLAQLPWLNLVSLFAPDHSVYTRRSR